MSWQKYLKAISVDNKLNCGERVDDIEFREYRRIAREALEIQIPEKPLFSADFVTGKKEFKCPRCKGIVPPKCKAPTHDNADYIYIIINNHCDHCGQYLNWAGAYRYIGVNWSEYEVD